MRRMRQCLLSLNTKRRWACYQRKRRQWEEDKWLSYDPDDDDCESDRYVPDSPAHERYCERREQEKRDVQDALYRVYFPSRLPRRPRRQNDRMDDIPF